MTAARRLPHEADRPADATHSGGADSAAGSHAAADAAGGGRQTIDLSSSRMHIAIVLDRLQAADHHQIVGRWPSLLIVTEKASVQLDPASGLTCAQAALMSGRLLREVARWDAAIRRCDCVTPERRPTRMDIAEGT
ncbi:hypothetical protein BH20ACT5_BH20ACT5_08870 [soil metagenome]